MLYSSNITVTLSSDWLSYKLVYDLEIVFVFIGNVPWFGAQGIYERR